MPEELPTVQQESSSSENEKSKSSSSNQGQEASATATGQQPVQSPDSTVPSVTLPESKASATGSSNVSPNLKELAQSTEKFARTKLESDSIQDVKPASTSITPPEGKASEPVNSSVLPNLKELAQSTEKFARTKLDYDSIQDMKQRSLEEKEVKLAEQIKAQAAEPPKPFHPIENYKMATPCSSKWENPECKERVSFCEQCKCQVYDFNGMEMPEAEEIIFKRENRRNVPLFKRQDGKFLTSDCPVGVRRKRDMVLVIVGGSLLVVGLLSWLMTMPPPPKPAATPEAKAPPEYTAKGPGVGKPIERSPSSGTANTNPSGYKSLNDMLNANMTPNQSQTSPVQMPPNLAAPYGQQSPYGQQPQPGYGISGVAPSYGGQPQQQPQYSAQPSPYGDGEVKPVPPAPQTAPGDNPASGAPAQKPSPGSGNEQENTGQE